MVVLEVEIQAEVSPVAYHSVALWHARQDEIVSLCEMLDVYAQKFYQIGRVLENLRAGLGQETVFDAQLSNDYKIALIANLRLVMDWCKEIQLIPVASYARNCLTTPMNQLTYNRVRKMLEGLQERLEENLSGAYFKFVPLEKSIFYRMSYPFGQNVADQFPSAVYDVEEATKCFALGRNTACVMHLMRVAEVGLMAYGASLNVMAQITSAQSNWGKVLQVANDEMRRLNASSDPTWTPEKKVFFEDMHALLHAVRVAWRNPSMHADQQYDYPRAKRIYEAIRDWMRHMADHLGEAGQFTP